MIRAKVSRAPMPMPNQVPLASAAESSTPRKSRRSALSSALISPIMHLGGAGAGFEHREARHQLGVIGLGHRPARRADQKRSTALKVRHQPHRGAAERPLEEFCRHLLERRVARRVEPNGRPVGARDRQGRGERLE